MRGEPVECRERRAGIVTGTLEGDLELVEEPGCLVAHEPVAAVGRPWRQPLPLPVAVRPRHTRRGAHAAPEPLPPDRLSAEGWHGPPVAAGPRARRRSASAGRG